MTLSQIDWQLVYDHATISFSRIYWHCLKDQDKVAGTASAASIWNTGAIGLAVAFNRYEIAILLAALNFLSLFIFGKIKKEIVSEREKRE